MSSWAAIYDSYAWLKQPIQQIDPEKALTNFAYYAAALLRIRDRDRRLSSLNIYRRAAQMVLDHELEKSRKAGQPFEAVILKSRRQGVSTYCEARIFYEVTTNENTDAIIIAHDDNGVETVFGYSKLFYDCLLPEWQPLKRYDNSKALIFENPDPKGRIKEPGLRSSIRVYKARNYAAARSQGTHAIHYSEVAFFPESSAAACINASLDTLQSSSNYMVFFESTANGAQGVFFDMWQECIDPSYRGIRKAFFFPWFIDPKNKLPLESHVAAALEATLDDEEKELRKRYNLTLEQLWWRRHKLDQKGGDIELFHQEFPSTPHEAFIVSGNPVFSRDIIFKMLSQVKDPIWRGEIESVDGAVKLFPRSDGSFRIWERPLRDGAYVIGVDVGGELDVNDPAAIVVLRRTAPLGLADVVALWHGHADAVSLADTIIDIARFYNDAEVAIEINNQGIVTQNEVKKRYYNLYMWQTFDKFGVSMTKRLGWVTTAMTKPALIAFGRYAVHNELVCIPSQELLGEMQTFIKRGASGEAVGGARDDIVMAFLIALYVLHNTDIYTIPSSSLKEPVPQEASKVEEVLAGSNVDKDPFHFYDEIEEPAEKSWMAL